MSVAGGLHLAVERGREVAGTALQLFVKSARQWRAAPLAESAIDAFRSAMGAADLERHTLAHASYLINVAAPDAAVRERSIAALADELDRCELLGIPYLVLHPGSHVGAGEDRGLARVAQSLDRVLGKRRSGKGARRRVATRLLLETTAGQGTNLGHRFDHLGRILGDCRHDDRLGVCFDTCHALAAGYEFRDAATYTATFAAFDREVGLERLEAFHLNDSKHELGSRRDRHEHIGRGHVGLEAFRLLLNDPRFRGRPMVLETPKGEDLAEDRVNLGVLRGMVETAA